jgi:hypothetical protein
VQEQAATKERSDIVNRLQAEVAALQAALRCALLCAFP